MAVIHRALITWTLLTIFFILMILKVDDRSNLNWFVVFIPMFLFDVKLFSFFVIKTVQFWRRNGNHGNVRISVKMIPIMCVLLKVIFEILLCLRLQYSIQIPLLVIVAPLTTLFLLLSVVSFVNLVHTQRSN
ncbi:Transmembrane protein 60-like protein [Leptotrombidium deliense]|uniref:Transmembrane protein 60-like protein n=1 Tax=Leptotrombidium deliense TaxID=299467 RepID=A0A443STA9_9ACAR|nr:Transmembrane protein 60-like protein [Leptotrombidium deliense]